MIRIISKNLATSGVQSMESKEDANLVSLDVVITELNNTGSYFLNIFRDKGLDIGILRVKVGEKDTQLPHSVDEVYFVVEGNGSIEIEGKLKPVKSADFIFVYANTRHRFIVGNQDLVVIYFFPS
jgi:mannose-6-phosphate isomerase-like protein (cupin superfamily)